MPRARNVRRPDTLDGSFVSSALPCRKADQFVLPRRLATIAEMVFFWFRVSHGATPGGKRAVPDRDSVCSCASTISNGSTRAAKSSATGRGKFYYPRRRPFTRSMGAAEPSAVTSGNAATATALATRRRSDSRQEPGCALAISRRGSLDPRTICGEFCPKLPCGGLSDRRHRNQA